MLGKIKLQLLGYITNHPKTWQLKTAIILLSITVCQSGIREVRGSDSGVSVRSQSDVRWGYSQSESLTGAGGSTCKTAHLHGWRSVGGLHPSLLGCLNVLMAWQLISPSE